MKGLTRGIGLSNCNAEQVRRAHAAAARRGVPILVNQIMYNLLDYNSPALRETEQTCIQLKILVMAYAPLGQGLLTEGLTEEKFGTIRAVRMTRIKFGELTDLRETIRMIAQRHQRTMAQVCLNWVIGHGHMPLVGVRSVKQANDSVGCLGWSLTAEDIKELDKHALSASTLSKPKSRRILFVFLIGIVILVYRVSSVVERSCAWLRGADDKEKHKNKRS
eukprot:c17736_g1_i4.p1 GENE.c17736_g1_i4~~c17736_g1_i4.p1  ORF type:complete len:220 (+),score=38.04 c17736_g1_i4:478-1137(+)